MLTRRYVHTVVFSDGVTKLTCGVRTDHCIPAGWRIDAAQKTGTGWIELYALTVTRVCFSSKSLELNAIKVGRGLVGSRPCRFLSGHNHVEDRELAAGL